MTKLYRIIIIDDEQMARNMLKIYLQEFEHIEIVAECENGFDGLKAIQDHKPDFVFLDIQMPKLTGLEMLELLDDVRPHVIFTTAYDQYAIDAFEKNAVDYLLKPFPKDRLKAAVQRVVDRIESKQIDEHIEHDHVLQAHDEKLDRVVVKDKSRIHILPISEIKYFESLDDYVMIYTEKKRFVKQKTMKFFETSLPENEFVRIHRSFIVNVDCIGQIEQYERETHIIILKTGEKLKVSKSGYKKLKGVLNF